MFNSLHTMTSDAPRCRCCERNYDYVPTTGDSVIFIGIMVFGLISLLLAGGNGKL